MTAELSERLHFPIETLILSETPAKDVICEAVIDMVRRLRRDPEARAGTLRMQVTIERDGYIVAGSCLKWGDKK